MDDDDDDGDVSSQFYFYSIFCSFTHSFTIPFSVIVYACDDEEALLNCHLTLDTTMLVAALSLQSKNYC